MTEADAITLVRDAISEKGGHWADLGAGTGTFTRALAALIGPDGNVEAIEPNATSRRELLRQAHESRDATVAAISASSGDFTRPLALSQLSGVLLANSLHFVPYTQQAAVLRQLSTYLAASGRIVVVEYDQDGATQWVPYPVSLARFNALCETAGLPEPMLTGRMPSAFGGRLYSACTVVG